MQKDNRPHLRQRYGPEKAGANECTVNTGAITVADARLGRRPHDGVTPMPVAISYHRCFYARLVPLTVIVVWHGVLSLSGAFRVLSEPSTGSSTFSPRCRQHRLRS